MWLLFFVFAKSLEAQQIELMPWNVLGIVLTRLVSSWSCMDVLPYTTKVVLLQLITPCFLFRRVGCNNILWVGLRCQQFGCWLQFETVIFVMLLRANSWRSASFSLASPLQHVDDFGLLIIWGVSIFGHLSAMAVNCGEPSTFSLQCFKNERRLNVGIIIADARVYSGDCDGFWHYLRAWLWAGWINGVTKSSVSNGLSDQLSH